ncbi:MAG TPA: hypothetical protein VNF99_06675 [Stellaceae bacterium]|nr:hypothetical protein [Stellaceae bacterium]
MATTFNTVPPRAIGALPAEDAAVSAVSWAAVFAGALGAVAISVILIELGLGLGLSSVSAWTNTGASIATLGVMGGVWLIVVQWIASGIGGYLAGRLRTKWVGVHTDEVFFRDTAHGFLAWSVATLFGVLIVAASASSLLSAGGRVAGAAVSGAAQGAALDAAAGSRQGAAAQPMNAASDPYYVDMMFRPATPAAPDRAAAGAGAAPATAVPSATGTAATPNAGSPAMARNGNAGNGNAEAVRIFARDLPSGALAPEDRSYLAQTIAARTGISQAEAEKRVDATVAQIKSDEAKAQQAAEKARKAAASGSIIGALAMVVGAFIASVAAAIGGRLRDAF